MASGEMKYLDYRALATENIDIFKYRRGVLLISPAGKDEELEVVGEGFNEGYHFDRLINRFKHLPMVDCSDEYVLACAAAKYENYIVFIIDTISLSIFLPSFLTDVQKNTLMHYLLQLSPGVMLFAEVAPADEAAKMTALNEGEEISAASLINVVHAMPVVQFNVSESPKR